MVVYTRNLASMTIKPEAAWREIKGENGARGKQASWAETQVYDFSSDDR